MELRAVELPPRAPGLDRTLVLFHGFGADEHDLLPIGHELDPRLRVVSLQAPIALDFGGRAWFNLQQTPQGLEDHCHKSSGDERDGRVVRSVEQRPEIADDQDIQTNHTG